MDARTSYEMLSNVMLKRVARLRENIPTEVPDAVESDREDEGRWMGLFILTIDGDGMGAVLVKESGSGCEISKNGSGQSGGALRAQMQKDGGRWMDVPLAECCPT